MRVLKSNVVFIFLLLLMASAINSHKEKRQIVFPNDDDESKEIDERYGSFGSFRRRLFSQGHQNNFHGNPFFFMNQKLNFQAGNWRNPQQFANLNSIQQHQQQQQQSQQMRSQQVQGPLKKNLRKTIFKKVFYTIRMVLIE